MILGNGAFPLKTWPGKSYGDVLDGKKSYFKKVLVSQKTDFMCYIENVKDSKGHEFGLLVLHKMSIERGDIIPRGKIKTLIHQQLNFIIQFFIISTK